MATLAATTTMLAAGSPGICGANTSCNSTGDRIVLIVCLAVFAAAAIAMVVAWWWFKGPRLRRDRDR